MAQQPVVQRRLRLFKQAHVGQASLARGGQRQRARAFVKRRGHGQHQLLLLQRASRKAPVPRRAHIAQIAGTGLDRRDLDHLVGRAPRQDGRLTINRAVRQPALGAGHQPARHLRAQLARPLAKDDRRLAGIVSLRVGRPRQPQRASGQLARGGVIAHRRQQRQRGDFAGRHQLRNVKQRNVRRPGALARACQRRISHHGVRGAQVDADEVLTGHLEMSSSGRRKNLRQCRVSMRL